jgi:hypothetical protein
MVCEQQGCPIKQEEEQDEAEQNSEEVLTMQRRSLGGVLDRGYRILLSLPSVMRCCPITSLLYSIAVGLLRRGLLSS